MKPLLVLTLILASLSPAPADLARCTGSRHCSACANCRYCRHCNQGDGACSVCSHHESPK